VSRLAFSKVELRIHLKGTVRPATPLEIARRSLLGVSV
jgi:hypothetical protein